MDYDCRIHLPGKYKTTPWLFVLFILIPLNLPAQIYKWVDENGNTHFGDKPPGESAEEIELKTKPIIDNDLNERRQKQQRLLEVFDEERQERKEKKAALKEENKKRKANCAKAQQNLQEIKDASFLYNETGDPDNPEILSTAERQKATKKAQAQVERWCK